MKHIGIICEGPTDYIILKGVIDRIIGEENTYVMLQPENDLTGKYGNGWKGVWKWCYDNASIRKELMKGIQPALDFLLSKWMVMYRGKKNLLIAGARRHNVFIRENGIL